MTKEAVLLNINNFLKQVREKHPNKFGYELYISNEARELIGEIPTYEDATIVEVDKIFLDPNDVLTMKMHLKKSKTDSIFKPYKGTQKRPDKNYYKKYQK